MKKTLILILAVTLMGVFAYTQQVKIGIVNAQEVLMKTKAGAKVQKKLEELQGKKQAELQVKQNEIKQLEKDLMSPALNNDTRAKKTDDLTAKRTDLKRFYEDAQREVQRESAKELAALENEIMPLINKIGKEKGYTAIFDRDRSGLVYYDPAADITQEIIKALDSKN